jgi:hypothetical protein
METNPAASKTATLMIPAARLARASHPGGHDGLVAVPVPESS